MEGELSLIKYPLISDATIQYLHEAFPNKLPTTKVSEFELGRLIGMQEIIGHLDFINKENYNNYDEEND